MIPVLGFATLKRFDLADRLLASIDYPVEHLVIVDNSGLGEAGYYPTKPESVKSMWVLRVPFGLGLVGAWNLVVKSTPYAPYWLTLWAEEKMLGSETGWMETPGAKSSAMMPSWAPSMS